MEHVIWFASGQIWLLLPAVFLALYQRAVQSGWTNRAAAAMFVAGRALAWSTA